MILTERATIKAPIPRTAQAQCPVRSRALVAGRRLKNWPATAASVSGSGAHAIPLNDRSSWNH
jgi:hypothetical protein